MLHEKLGRVLTNAAACYDKGDVRLTPEATKFVRQRNMSRPAGIGRALLREVVAIGVRETI